MSIRDYYPTPCPYCNPVCPCCGRPLRPWGWQYPWDYQYQPYWAIPVGTSSGCATGTHSTTSSYTTGNYCNCNLNDAANLKGNTPPGQCNC